MKIEQPKMVPSTKEEMEKKAKEYSEWCKDFLIRYHEYKERCKTILFKIVGRESSF